MDREEHAKSEVVRKLHQFEMTSGNDSGANLSALHSEVGELRRRLRQQEETQARTQQTWRQEIEVARRQHHVPSQPSSSMPLSSKTSDAGWEYVQSQSPTHAPSSASALYSRSSASSGNPPQVRRLSLLPEDPQAHREDPESPSCAFFDLGQESDDYEDYEKFEVRAVFVDEQTRPLVRESGVEAELELKSSSTLLFNISGDSECELSDCSCECGDCGCERECCKCELMEYGECSSRSFESDCEREVRMVIEEHDARQFEEVILDSGADVTVLPLSHEEVGETSRELTNIRDAQGNPIPTAKMRKNVIFEIEGLEGERLFFRDKAVIGQVRQPLFCVGKLMRENWMPKQTERGLCMTRGSQGFSVHWSRNSLATHMKIHRVKASESFVRMIVEIPDALERLSVSPGWKLRSTGQPMHVSLSADVTQDPSLQFPSARWPFHTTLLSKGGRMYEVFESGEFWEDRKLINTYAPKVKMITLLSQDPVEPESVGVVQSDPSSSSRDRRPEAEQIAPPQPESSEADGQRAGGAEEKQLELIQGDVVPMETGDSVLVVNGIEILQSSSLGTLRAACKFLRVSPHGSKAVLWGRLQTEIADAQTKAAVQASDAVLAEFSRKPQVQPIAEMPDPETVALHEVTHYPRMPWCSACVASRSKEDAHKETEPKEKGTIHVDLMFNRTESPGESEHPMAIHVVAVDEQTNFVIAVAVESKSGEHLKTAVLELTKLAAMLGHTNVVIRGDSEPAMKNFLRMVESTRTRLGVATTIEYVAPESKLHHGLKAERFIDIVRSMGKCLLATVEEKTGFKVKSSHPLFQWAFRHGAFLYCRFHVLRCGQTPFELVHGRSYAGKLCPFGSVVFAQVLPITKAKAESWRKCVWLGKSSLGNLNLVADAQGVHYARSFRRGALTFDSEAIASMKGVPWNSQLDTVPVKRKKAPRFRVPELEAQALPGQEGDSAPPLEPPAAVDGGVPLGAQQGASSENTGGSSSMSESSAGSQELIADSETPDASQVTEVFRAMLAGSEGAVESPSDEAPKSSLPFFLQRIVREDLPVNDEEEMFPGLSGLDGELPEGERVMDEIEPYTDRQEPDADQPESRWKDLGYEDGPPVLSAAELEELDALMDEREFERLKEMGVLRKMTRGDDFQGKMKLQSKLVRDWRYRGGWVRRSRLVAKEYRFLEPALEDLYAPASVGIMQKLMAGLCVSGKGLVIYNVDVSDAYLQVPQQRPTYITTSSGEAFELLFNLPGQRCGARGWYDHFKSIVESDGVKAFVGAPAVFYEPQSIACSSHVDDFQIVGSDSRAKRLLDKLSNSGLNLKVEGPIDASGGQGHFLKRLYVGDGSGVRVVPEQKYTSKLIEVLELQRSATKSTPLPSSINYPANDKDLEGDDYHLYRSGLGLLLYMSADITEIHFAVRLLGSKCAKPSEYDLYLTRHVGKFLKGRPEWVVKLASTFPGRTLEQRLREGDTECTGKPGLEHAGESSFGHGHVLEVVTDADWGSKFFGRKSVSCYSLFLNGNMIYLSTRIQKSLSLSSCESEWMASLSGVADGIFVKSFLEAFLKSEVKLIHRVDNSGTRGLAAKEGAGRLRHIDLCFLWLQRENKKGTVMTRSISTKGCPSDIGTKIHNKKRLLFLIGLMGFVDNLSGVPAGEKEVNEYLVATSLKQSSPGSHGNILRVLLASMIGGSRADLYSINHISEEIQYGIHDISEEIQYGIHDISEEIQYGIHDISEEIQYGIHDISEEIQYGIHDISEEIQYGINDISENVECNIKDITEDMVHYTSGVIENMDFYIICDFFFYVFIISAVNIYGLGGMTSSTSARTYILRRGDHQRGWCYGSRA